MIVHIIMFLLHVVVLALFKLVYCVDDRNLTKETSHQPPDFFIIGAAKCGTTSLHKLLLTHDEICNIGTKELHYFDRPKEYHKGSKSYFQHFHTHCNKYYIDSTPDYLSHQDTVPLEMTLTYSAEDLKKKKFIVILRDPVYRAYSWYNHLMKHCVASMSDYITSQHNDMPHLGWDTFELCEDTHCDDLQCRSRAKYAKKGQEVNSLATFAQYYESGNLDIAKGHYIVQLKTWLEFFPRSQFLIINLSALLEDTPDTMQRITSFLGLSHSFSHSVKLPHENEATVETEFDCTVRQELYKHFDPYTTSLMNFLHANDSSLDVVDRRPPMEPYFQPFKEYKCN